MNQHDLAEQDLKKAGYYLQRKGKKHDIWHNPTINCSIPLKRHDFDNEDRRYINKEIKRNAGK